MKKKARNSANRSRALVFSRYRILDRLRQSRVRSPEYRKGPCGMPQVLLLQGGKAIPEK